MAAFINALMEEGTKQDCLEQVVKLWDENCDLRRQLVKDQSAHFTAELLRLKNRFDTIFNNVLCDMKPGWDDSIEGFNKAWDIARDIFREEIGRAAQRALTDETGDTK